MIEAWVALPLTVPACVAMPWVQEPMHSSTKDIAAPEVPWHLAEPWALPGCAESVAAVGRLTDRQTVAHRDWSDAVTAELEKVAQLSIGWDGHEGVVPDPTAIAQMKQFYGLVPATVQLPTVEPSGDGEVSLVWREVNRYFEIGTYGDGFSYYAKIDGREFMGDLANGYPSLSKELRGILDHFQDGRL